MKAWYRVKPYLAVIFMQFGIAGLAIIAKFALNDGMSPYVFVVYRQAVAAIVITPFALVLERYIHLCHTLFVHHIYLILFYRAKKK